MQCGMSNMCAKDGSIFKRKSNIGGADRTGYRSSTRKTGWKLQGKSQCSRVFGAMSLSRNKTRRNEIGICCDIDVKNIIF